MLNVQALLASSDFAQATVDEDDGLQQKLNLYQVFLRLYEQNRSLLDEILKLENSSLGNGFTRSTITHYVQGFTLNGHVGLVTNLMRGATQTIFQPQNIWTIGRDRRKSIIPIADTRLSRCHAAIAYRHDDANFCLMDLSSTNGTFVNSEQIREHHVLQDGDRVRLGSLSFTFFTCSSIRQASPVSADVISQVSCCLSEDIDQFSIDHIDETLDIALIPPPQNHPKSSSIHSCASGDSAPEGSQFGKCVPESMSSDDAQTDTPPAETLMFLRRLPE